MAKLPVVGGRQAVRAFEALGREVARQTGSHVILVRDGHPATLSVPDHAESPRGRSGA
ncbi:MAG: type II toxin-antitoxin system HicA family toxin [Gemmataceae bacterium]|nr:type II toxin-antitoxin system HicA family toxin [Gemmataceae bacterium]